MVVGAVERGGRIRVAVVEKGKPHAIRQFSSVASSSRLCSKNQQHLRLALDRQRPDGDGEVGARLWPAGLPGFSRERADQLLVGEQIFALLLDEHAAEDLPEQPDVPAERCYGPLRAV
jgi:hypothetical protein